MSDSGNNMYWVLSTEDNPNAMLLKSLPEPGPWLSWMSGRAFPSPPPQPVIAKIKPGYEEADPPVFKNVPQIMTMEFFEALRSAGVDNIDGYDAEIRSVDGSRRLPHYKAYNIIGLVSAADHSESEFAEDNPSRQIDASIRSLVVDEAKARQFLLFRLAESVDTILVHNSVKEALEKQGFEGIDFVPPDLHIS
jgi:hypothetical protein